MSQYSVKRINYVASGKDRTFINMDTCLDVDGIRDYVHLLAQEGFIHPGDPTLSDVLLEQRGGDFYKTRFLEACSTEGVLCADHPDADNVDGPISAHEAFWNDHVLSTRLSAYALNGSVSSIFLNEQQQYYNEISSSDVKYVRLHLSCCTDDYRKRLLDFYNSSLRYSATYVIEHNQVDGDMNQVGMASGAVRPMYEIADICIKSKNPLQHSNLVDFDGTASSAPTRTEDFYLPDSAEVTGFCQIDDHVYMMTKSTGDSPLYARVDKGVARLCSEQLSTYLYVLLADTGASSYSQYLSSVPAERFFASPRDFGRVQCNYVAKAPMSSIVKGFGSTKYGNDNLYAGIFSTKSAYDSSYSMSMPSDSVLSGCREYSEVNSCAGRPYLKFDDCVTYAERAGQVVKTVPSVRSYPKIESLNPVASRSAKAHKSCFFSVNILDSEMAGLKYDSSSVKPGVKDFNKLKMQIRHDITEAVRQIVRNVCPVQTQLFEVQFNGEA